MEKPVQYFTDEYLENCKKLSTDQILRFLDDYRKLQVAPGKLMQINLRVPTNVLKAFKARATREGISYQKKIKELMAEWVYS